MAVVKRVPSFKKLWTNFPTHGAFPSMKELYEHLGGQVARAIDDPGFGPAGNTCASRLSMAFNLAGAPIDASVVKDVRGTALRAADQTLILFRVREFRAYLERVLGKPSLDDIRPFDSDFVGRTGIIAFTVNWSDATGHIALWNGENYREASDNYATYVNQMNPNIKTLRAEFWELK